MSEIQHYYVTKSAQQFLSTWSLIIHMKTICTSVTCLFSSLVTAAGILHANIKLYLIVLCAVIVSYHAQHPESK